MNILERWLGSGDSHSIRVLALIIVANLRQPHCMVQFLKGCTCIQKDSGPRLSICICEIYIREEKIPEDADISLLERSYANNLVRNLPNNICHIQERSAACSSRYTGQNIDIEGFHICARDQVGDCRP